MSRQILTTNREGWGRIFGAVRTVENGGRGVTPPPPQYRTGDDPPIVLGKTTAAWAKGATQSIPVYSGAAGSETATGFSVTAMNKFAAIASGKWVILAGPNQGGVWYLISAECS
jgi:hypothetical protein